MDTNWYAKRGLLAAAFVSSELVLVSDKSDGFADTFAFLERRIDDVTRASKAVSGCREAADGVARSARQALDILGAVQRERQ